MLHLREKKYNFYVVLFVNNRTRIRVDRKKKMNKKNVHMCNVVHKKL